MHTESLTRIFLTFVFFMHRDFKRICKRYRLRLQRLDIFFCPFGQLYLSIVSIGDSEDTLDDIGGVEIYEQSNFFVSNP